MRVIDRCDSAIGLFIARDPMAGVLAPAAPAIELQAGVDIAGLIAHAINQGFLDPEDLPDLRVYVDGQALPFATYEQQAETLDLVPAKGSVVNLQVEPQNGSNGLARTVLQVVLVAVAVVSAFTVGSFTASVWMAASAIVPQVVFPIKRPDALAGPNDQGALNAAGNQIRRRGPMPLVLGKGRVAFDVAANAYTSNVGGEVWLNVIFGVHLGPCSVDDIKIGETLLSDYPAEDVQVESFLTPGPRAFSFYAQSVHPEPLQDELDLGGAAEVHTTAEACDRVELDITCPSGLSFRKDSGSIVQQEVRVQIRWAPVGTESWQAAPLEGGPYRDRLGNVLPTGTVDIIARTQDPVRRTFGWDKSDDSQIKIEVRAWDPDNDDATKATQATYWTGLRSIVKKKPIIDQDLSCIAMRIKSSDDLGGTLPVVTGVVTPHAPVYDPDTGLWTDAYEDWAPSDNGAALTRMLLLGPAAARPHDPEEWGDSFGAVYNLIEEHGWKGCYRLEGQASQEDALKILGQIGHFSGYDAGEGLVLVPDWEKPVARQLFTGLNVEDYSYTRNYPDPLHAVIVEFSNIDENGDNDETVVYQPGYGPLADPDADPPILEATEIETIRLDWQCSGERATREGRTFLAKRNIGVEVHEWTAGPSAIASSYGSRVLLRHASALYGQAEARVQYRHMAGGLVAGVRLSDVVEMVEGEVYAIDVQRVDRIIPGLTVSTQPGRTKDLWFPTPLEADDAPEKDDLLAFGRAEVVTEDLEIVDFAPADDGVRISARKYIGPALVAAETGEIPTFQTKLTPRPRAPTPRLLGEPQATPDGVKIAFSIDEVRGSLVEGFPIRWRRASTGADENPWINAPAAGPTARVAMTPPLLDAVSAGRDPQAEYRVDVEVRCKIKSGDVSQPLRCDDILITRDVPVPTDFIAAGDVRASETGASFPVLTISAGAVTSGPVQDLIVEVRPHGAGDDAYVSAGQALPATNPVGDYSTVTGGARLDVRAAFRTSDNWTSDWVTVSNVEIPAGALVADDSKALGGITGAQIRAIDAAIRKAQLDILDARLKALADLNAAVALLRQVLDGKPLGEVLAEQVQVLVNTNVAVGQNTAAIVSEATARQTAISAEAYQRTVLATEFNGFKATTASELISLSTANSTTAASLATVTTDFNGFKATASTTLISLSNATSATASNLTALQATVADNKATADAGLVATTTDISALSTQYTSLNATVAANKASADASLSALATATSATAASLTTLESTVAANKASADAGLLTVATDISALSTQYTSLNATVAANKASADSSLSVLTSNLSSTAASLTTLTSNFNSFQSSATTSLTTLSNAQSTQASQITTLQSTAASLSASLSVQGSTLADVAGKVATARFVVQTLATGGQPAVLGVTSDSLSGSNIALTAAQIYFGPNTVFTDATKVLRTDLADAVYMQTWGAPFGAASDLFLWFGPPGISYSAATRANAYFYISKTAPYLGGSAFPSGGGGGFEVNLSTPLVSANRFGAGSATTDTVTVTTSGGDGAVTYSWAYLSGAGFTPSSTTGDAVAFTGTITSLGQTLDGYWRVTARDEAGHVAFADVRILISENS